MTQNIQSLWWCHNQGQLYLTGLTIVLKFIHLISIQIAKQNNWMEVQNCPGCKSNEISNKNTGRSKSLCAPDDCTVIVMCTETFWSPCIIYIYIHYRSYMYKWIFLVCVLMENYPQPQGSSTLYRVHKTQPVVPVFSLLNATHHLHSQFL
jgi:hypothetical protein